MTICAENRSPAKFRCCYSKICHRILNLRDTEEAVIVRLGAKGRYLSARCALLVFGVTMATAGLIEAISKASTSSNR